MVAAMVVAMVTDLDTAVMDLLVDTEVMDLMGDSVTDPLVDTADISMAALTHFTK